MAPPPPPPHGWDADDPARHRTINARGPTEADAADAYGEEDPLTGSVALTRKRSLRRYQAQAFVLTWLTYMSLYMTRKPVSVTKKRLEEDEGLSKFALSMLDTGYLATYAVGQFVNGKLGDLLGSRLLMASGLFGSAGMCALVGFRMEVWLLVLFWSLNGYFQACGWPGCIKGMTPWFSATERGRVMGLWSTCYQVGGVVGTALATLMMDQFGWQWSFWAPSFFIISMALLVIAFMVNHPTDVGLVSPLDEDVEELSRAAQASPAVTKKEVAADEGPSADISVWQALWLPGVLNIGGAYFCLKLIRYSLLFWLPYYLAEELDYSDVDAGYLSIAFDVGGAFGSVLTGYISDRYANGRRVMVAMPEFFLAALSLGLYIFVGGYGYVPNALALALVGLFIFGPDSLLAGAAAQDIGGRASSTVAGLINGIGSIGAILEGVVTKEISDAFGWNGVFYMLMILCIAAMIFLLPLLRKELRSAPPGL